MSYGKKFEGLIIGGPNFGRMYAHDRPRFRVPVLPDVPIACPQTEFETGIGGTVVEYEIITGIRFGGSKAVDFWVPVGKNAEWAITELLAAYQRMPVVTALEDRAEEAEARVKQLEKAARGIMPYLEWTISDEAGGCHPTMPSAVSAFHAAVGPMPSFAERFSSGGGV